MYRGDKAGTESGKEWNAVGRDGESDLRGPSSDVRLRAGVVRVCMLYCGWRGLTSRQSIDDGGMDEVCERASGRA